MNLKALREAAGQIFRASVQAVDAADAVRRHLAREGGHLLADWESYRLDAIDRIQSIGLPVRQQVPPFTSEMPTHRIGRINRLNRGAKNLAGGLSQRLQVHGGGPRGRLCRIE